MEMTYKCGRVFLGSAELCVITGYPFQCEVTQIFCLDRIANYKNHSSYLSSNLPQHPNKKQNERNDINVPNRVIHQLGTFNEEEKLEFAINHLTNDSDISFLFLFLNDPLRNQNLIDLYFRTFNSFALHTSKAAKVYYYFNKDCIGAAIDWFDNFYYNNRAKVNQVELSYNQFRTCIACQAIHEQRFFTIWICREICDFCAFNSGIMKCQKCGLDIDSDRFNHVNKNQICNSCGKIEVVENPREFICRDCKARKRLDSRRI